MHSHKSQQPLYLRLSVTDRCNYRCRYCRPDRSQGPSGKRRLGDEQILELIQRIHHVAPLGKVRLTGGEALLHPGLARLVCGLRFGLPGAKIHLTTNGSRLARLARPLKQAGLRGINISLDTLDENRFSRLTRGARLHDVLDGLDAAQKAGFKRLKLNAVLQRSYNGDQICDLARLAVTRGCELRFIELMPIGAAAGIFDKEFLPASEALEYLKQSFCHVRELPDQGTARRHLLRIDDREIVVGFITPVSHPFCETCNRIRLDSYGWLYSCLRLADRVNLATLLRQGRLAELDDHVHCIVGQKCGAGAQWPVRSMAAIGG